MDLFHALVDLGFGAGSFLDGLSRSVSVELISAGDGGLVDPVSADGLAPDEYGQFFDHLRAVGIRGFVAEHTHDEDFTYPSEARAEHAEMREEGADETDE